MTIFEALRGLSAFPVAESYIGETIVRRYLNMEDEATAEVLNSRKYLLAKADIYMWLVYAPSISQGGISFSLTDEQRAQYKALAEGIYAATSEERIGAVTYGFKGTRL